jgi:hypothetical protein
MPALVMRLARLELTCSAARSKSAVRIASASCALVLVAGVALLIKFIRHRISYFRERFLPRWARTRPKGASPTI